MKKIALGAIFFMFFDCFVDFLLFLEEKFSFSEDFEVIDEWRGLVRPVSRSQLPLPRPAGRLTTVSPPTRRVAAPTVPFSRTHPQGT